MEIALVLKNNGKELKKIYATKEKLFLKRWLFQLFFH